MASLPRPGESLFGFTATESGTIEMLGAKTAEFYHKASGARLLYIQNDDRELGFNLIFRTPQIDETDTNHVLEHLVLCSSKKYPSRDIFFDMDSKSYATFMNGITDNTYTCYPICSQSQNQLLRLADVVLSCMEQPDAMEDPHFYMREGLRFELEEENGPLTLHGTVLSEDWGHLTDLLENADSFMARTLYPGLTASHLLGRLHFHYKELTFQKVKAAYEQYYRFSNCLIVLYGQMDYKAVLAFLDREHLSKSPCAPQDFHNKPWEHASHLFSQPVKPGFTKARYESPAYEGSETRQDSVIDYAIDLSPCSQEELIFWDLLADVLDHESSVWHSFAKEEGINHMMEIYVDTLLPKPSLKFRLRNADEGQEEAFLHSIVRTLKELSLHGAEPEGLSASQKENRMSDLLTRESPHLGFTISEEIGHYWSITGKTDYFSVYEAAFSRFYGEESQAIIRKLATEALSPFASALVTTIPSPGLAEQLEQEKEQWLSDRLDSMTSAEKVQLIHDTKDFALWNENEESPCHEPAEDHEESSYHEPAADHGASYPEQPSGMDFLIEPEELPAPEAPAPFSAERVGDMLFYSSSVPGTEACDISQNNPSWARRADAPPHHESLADAFGIPEYMPPIRRQDFHSKTMVGSYQIYFDISGVSPEDRNYLSIYQMLLTELDTAHYTSREQKKLEQEYLHDCTFDEVFPGPEAGEHSRPMMSVFWNGFTEDFKPSLRFLLEIMGKADYTLWETIIRVLEKYLPDYDLSKADHASSLAFGFAEGCIRRDAAFRNLLNGQEIYYFLQKTLKRLRNEPDYRGILAGKLKGIADAILNRTRLIFLGTAPEAALEKIRNEAFELLSSLPSGNKESLALYGPQWSSLLSLKTCSAGICTDASSQEIRMMGDWMGRRDFKGRFLPFLLAVGDKYLKPALRYRGSAYDGGIDFYMTNSCFSLWSTADPEVASTIRIFRESGEELKKLELTEDELKGYILSAYSQALPPTGLLNSRMRFMRRDIMGLDTEKLNEMISDIKEARLTDQQEAAEFLCKVLEHAPAAVAGNERCILREKDVFDVVLNYRERK